MRRAACIVLACAGCLDAPERGGDGDGGVTGGDGGQGGEVVSQLDLGASTVRATRSRGSGNVYLTGGFSGDSPLAEGLSAEGVTDFYVAGVSGEDGALLYARRHGGAGAETSVAIAAEPATDEVVVVGQYEGVGSAGGEDLEAPVSDSLNLFVAGYDAEGGHRWSQAGRVNALIAPAGGLSLDGSGQALVAGFFDGELAIGGQSASSLGGHDIYYVPVSPDGTVGTLVQHGTEEGSEACTDAVSGGAGPIYLIGNFNGGFSIGGQVIEGNDGNFDGFVASINAGGDEAAWAVVMSGSGDFGSAVGAVRPDGGLILFGWFAGELDLPPGISMEAADIDMVVVSFDPTGTVEWARQMGGPGTDYPVSVAVTEDGRILLSGTFYENARFGDRELAGKGEFDGFVAMMDAEGEVAWVRGFGGPLDDAGTAAVEGAGGTVFAGVQFRGVIDFGGPEPLGEPGSITHAALIQLRP